MTSAPVTDVGLQIPYMNDMGGTRPADKADFMGSLKSAIESQSTNMNQADSTDTVSQIAPAKRTEDKGSEVQKPDRVEQKRDDSKGNEVKTDSKPADTDREAPTEEEAPDPETVDTVMEAAATIVNEISEQMDVSPEEVMQAMDDMGLEMSDLFDSSNMAEIITNLSGNQDVTTLLTDENLYQTLGELQDFVETTTESLMEELDLSQEALDEVLTQTEELLQHPTDEMMPIVPNENIKDAPLEGMKDFKTTITENGEQMTVSVRVDDTTGAQSAVYQSEGSSESESGDPSKEDRQMEEHEDNAPHHDTSLFTTNLQMNNQNTVQEVNITEQVPSFTPETKDIADQIMESMKANIRPEVTELEMNLHPASLGSVKVNLTASGGQVTAQFVAQNETVKAAIESQVTQLTNQLEEQGVKIEAVEVTLASHQFESRSDGNGAGEEQPGNEQSRPKVGKVRRLDLNAMEGDDDLEALDESDRIAADMMARNGNTVDYTV